MKQKYSFFPFAFIFMVVFLIFSSCKKVTYHQITKEEEQLWMPYSKNNEIKFANSLGDVDTFKVIYRVKGYRNGYNEFIDAPIDKVTDTIGGEDKRGGVYMYKDGSGLSVKVRLPHFHELREITTLPMNFAFVNGTSYGDVFIMAANPFYLDYDSSIDTMYYSQSAGFIKYVDKDGIDWDITN